MSICGLLVGACGGGGGGGGGGAARELDPDEISRLDDARLVVRVDGDVSLAFDETVDLRIVSINRPDATEVRFLSVGIEEARLLPDDVMFRIAFDFGGAYQGPGDYVLPAVGGDTPRPEVDPESPDDVDPNDVAFNLSRVYLNYYKMRPGETMLSAETVEAEHTFENMVEPCELEIGGEEASSGQLRCPKVMDFEGNEVSIEMGWERVEDQA